MANIDAEIASTTTNHEESSPTSENEIQISSAVNAEQTDSRVTDPDGAQSPASSTYADCEDQNDNSSSENQPLNSVKEKHDQVGDDEIMLSHDNTKTDNASAEKVDNDEVTHETEPKNKCEINNNSKCDDESDSKTELDNTVDTVDLTNDTSDKESSKKVQESVTEDKYPDISENEDDIYAEDEEIDQYYAENNKSDLDEEYSDDGSDQQDKDRENGDGEEENEEEIVAEKELDDDEDRRNPQYIPKRGFFYEHDDRTVVTSEDETSEGAKKEADVKEPETKGKGKRFIPDGRWQHDMYREDEQKPKSSQELIDLYGYDIRNEEAAPKARRRRKYGRGPNKYTRKWDDEGAYAKQAAAKPFRGRNKTSFKKEDYDQEFPVLDEKQKRNTDQRTKEPSSSKKPYHSEPLPKHEDSKFKDETIENQKSSSDHHDRPARNFSKRIPNFKERPNFTPEHYDSMEFKRLQKTIRNSNYVPSNDNVVRSRGRGVGHGKNIRISNNYEDGSRVQFTPTNRGRSKRLERPSQHFYPSKPQVPAEDIRIITEQISAIDIEPKKLSSIDKLQYGDSENLPSNEQSDAQLASSNVRSKRYSHQRQRLLPEANKSNPTTLTLHQNLQQNLQPITHSVQNIQNVAASGLCRSLTPTHTSLSLITQNQCTPAPQTVATPLSVTPASISSNSLAVSASLIPLSAPPLTASGPALNAGAPPLPIMGFFQHPQAGFTNQATPAQLYPREQTVMGAPSNQPVQLVAFLPASPILSNTNHSQSAPPPPPPPPPPGFPTTVMSYQQTTQAPQNTASFNSESYPMPPVTLAPIHQPPEVYQSRGGVTYYNTRSQVKPRSPPPPRVKTAIPIVPPPSSESLK